MTSNAFPPYISIVTATESTVDMLSQVECVIEMVGLKPVALDVFLLYGGGPLFYLCVIFLW